MLYSIYKITQLSTGAVYIGQTTGSIFSRFKRHCREARNGKKQSALYRAMRADVPPGGSPSDYSKHFSIELVFSTDNELIALDQEKNEIKKYKNLKIECLNRNPVSKIYFPTKTEKEDIEKFVVKPKITEFQLLQEILSTLKEISSKLDRI